MVYITASVMRGGSSGSMEEKHLLKDALKSASEIKNIIEFGANIGLNIYALKNLFPKINLSAIEINKEAIDRLLEIQDLKVYQGFSRGYTYERFI